MGRTIPTVKGGRLFKSETESDSIVVGTPAWYDWLEHHDSFTFVDRVDTFTARKSMLKTSGQFWKAYRTRQGKLYRIHLGYSHTLTLERLHAVAQAFSGEHVPDEPGDVSSKQPAASRLPSPRIAINAGNYMSLIQTKLYRPRSGGDLIPRARLIERLNAGLNGRVTLISAPAGFGKTTLLAQWLQTIDQPTAWLSLDENDNELRVFVQSLTAALQSAFPDAFQATARLLRAPRILPPDQVASLLINELADVPDDIILVLDDYHLIHSSEVHTLVNYLIEHMPFQLHLVLATRSDPPLPLARWRAKGHLNELRRTDLRFTLEETEAFLTRVLGSVAAHETAGALEERMEGWIAVLRIAALSLRNTSDRAAFIKRLRHNADSSVSSYLVEEILSQQTSAMQKFLEQTSILEQFCGELCAAILDSDASNGQVQATLDWLERLNLFLVPLDERQGWYRFHHLFQQLLQKQLQAHTSEDEIAMLHRRASAWYAEQGLIEEAIGHALAARDESSARQLVEAQFFQAFEQEQLVQIEHWLGLLPEEQIQGSPCLLVAWMWILQAQGQLKDFPRLLTAAERLLDAGGNGGKDLENPQSRILRALIATLWSEFQYITGQEKASLDSARSALEWIPPGEEYIASFALMYLAWSSQATGNEDIALVALQQALSDHSSQVNGAARLLFSQSGVYLAAGKLHQVEHTARHLLQTAQQADLALSQNFAHWLLGVVHYEWNKLDAAAYHFSVVIANQHQAHFWVVQDAMRGLALTYQAQVLGIQAQETTRALLEWVQGQNNIRDLMTAYAFCGHLALLQNEVESAEQWLEMAGNQDVPVGPMIFLEDPPITKVCLLLAKGDDASVAQGQVLLTQLLQHVEGIHNTRKTIQVLALQAWAYDLQGREAEAVDVLQSPLMLARPGGFMRTFADLSPLAKVLHELRKRRKAFHAVDKNLNSYLQDILAAMSPVATQAVSTEELLQQEGLEPLTDRELQILHLLDEDLTNKEIARKLVVTPGTVKVHTNNVYRKLSVNNRRAAVTLAKALGFLAADHSSIPQWG
jgi:LuxR family transcriptional regulator, maltose regulon positive regulatory protein